MLPQYPVSSNSLFQEPILVFHGEHEKSYKVYNGITLFYFYVTSNKSTSVTTYAVEVV
jgi:hypothetical protein